MLQYILAGLALGSIYAVASAGLVVTFVSTGVLNFAFGSMAFVVARFYYWLNTQHGWSTTNAGLMSLLVMAPLLGIALYAVLFRFVRNRSTLVKIVVTIGLSVALPPIADLILGAQSITTAPGLALSSDRPFHFLGTPVTTDQVITYGFVLFIVLAGTVILKFTRVGLYVRASVDSESMASLSGTNPGRVAVGVWAVSTMMAGLAGILVAPTNGLTTVGMATLMAAAFAAVVAARLRSLVGVVAVSLAMGVVTDLVQEYLPPGSSFTAAIIPSIPFGFMLIFLVIYLLRSGAVADESQAGGPLDQAIRPADQDVSLPLSSGDASTSRLDTIFSFLPLAAVAVVPLIFHGSPYWLGLVAGGMCYAIVFMSFTVVTGEGGMLWLSQVIFAGGGALAAAQFVTMWHVPVLLAVVLGGISMAIVGAVIGLLTIRLGDLYVALVTLSFGLLIETLVFTLNQFTQGGLGVTINRPQFAGGDLAFSYFALVVFLIFGALILNLRRSTSGLALRAVRDSEAASRTLGVSVVQVKVIVGALGAFVAGVGGAFLAMDAGVAQPASFETFAGLVWLAVVVTLGVRSIAGAAIAGLTFALLPGVFQTYVPTRWAELPAILFGLGAISVAKYPDGVVVKTGRQLRHLVAMPWSASVPESRTRYRSVVSPRGRIMTDDAGRGAPPPRLSCRGVTVRYGGLLAVDEVEIAVPPGELVGLVGPNGAGKTTLFGALSGLIRPSSGTVLLEGHDVTHASPQTRASRGLARTFQHPEIFVGLTVRQHLVLAHRARVAKKRIWSDLFTLGSLRPVDADEKAVVDDLVDSLGLGSIADRLAIGLPLGVCRLVELGRALATAPTVLLLDEPSAGLDSTETGEFEGTLRRIASERGVSVLIVEHDVELVMRLCHTIYVLDFGILIAGGTPDEIRRDPRVQAAYLGEEIVPSGVDGQAQPSVTSVTSAVPANADEESPLTLTVENLCVRYGQAVAVSDASFRIRRGQALAILGPNGAGKSSLARAISGLVPAGSGTVRLNGQDITSEAPYRIRQAGVVHLPEGRGVFRRLSVIENLSMATSVLRGRQTRHDAIERAFEFFPVLAARRRQVAGSLSGGEQQMLSLARGLITSPTLVIADELSLGLAPILVDTVFEGLARAREAGVTLLIVEQYVHRALQFADECLILQRGAVAWQGEARGMGEDLLRHYLGESMTTAP